MPNSFNLFILSLTVFSSGINSVTIIKLSKSSKYFPPFNIATSGLENTLLSILSINGNKSSYCPFKKSKFPLMKSAPNQY